MTWTEHFCRCQSPYCTLEMKCVITQSFSSRDVVSVPGFDGMQTCSIDKENASQMPWCSPSLFLPLALSPSLPPCLCLVSLHRRSKVPVSSFCFTILFIAAPLSFTACVSVSPALSLCLCFSLMPSLSLETSRPQTSQFLIDKLVFCSKRHTWRFCRPGDTLWVNFVWGASRLSMERL